MASEPLFSSAYEALRFAVNYCLGAKPTRDSVNKIACPSKENTSGLGGVDGAAQAGIILAQLDCLTPEQRAVLIARLAIPRIPCFCSQPCCGGFRTNKIWLESCTYLAEVVLSKMRERRKSGRGPEDNHRLRLNLISKYVGIKVDVRALAESVEVSEQTAHAQKAWIFGILKELESTAWPKLEQRLVVMEITQPLNRAGE